MTVPAGAVESASSKSPTSPRSSSFCLGLGPGVLQQVGHARGLRAGGDHHVDLGALGDQRVGAGVLVDDQALARRRRAPGRPSPSTRPASSRVRRAWLSVWSDTSGTGTSGSEPMRVAARAMPPASSASTSTIAEHQGPAPLPRLLLVVLLVVGGTEDRGLRLGGRHDGRGRDHGGRGVDGLAVEVALDVGAHLRGALVAVLDLLGQRLHRDGVELLGQLGVVRPRRLGHLPHVLVGHRERAVADERAAGR